jgi:small-conductance mechanosensitive channel
VVTAAALEQAQVAPPVTLTYANRFIVQLRAFVIGRPPEERVASARATLDRLVAGGISGPVTTNPVGLAVSLELAGRPILVIMPSDVDALTGETPADVAAAAAGRLQVALSEVAELGRWRQLLVAVAEALFATALLLALVWLLGKAYVAVSARVGAAAERRLQATPVGDLEFIRATRIVGLLQRLIGVVTLGFGLFFAYSWLTFVLRRFPYTRPWGESLREFLLAQLAMAGVAILESLPGLFTVVLIILLMRFVTRLVYLFFKAVEAEKVPHSWVPAETAEPTRKLLTVGLWLFAVAIAYPYLPGSESDAFKGVSVFVGLVISLGSSGIVNQVMSGFTLTYSRALRVGDFVAVGDVEGTVTQVGTLSTKIKTVRGEDVTIPNALVVSQTVTNYSRFANTEGVFVPTQITIGYDVPWRQVQALLVLAASRSAGVRRTPAPIVSQSALEDFYIRYTLLFCIDHPAERRKTLATVHANILDAFNEYGVQITSPNYEADPSERKVVPRDQWFAAPAAPTPVDTPHQVSPTAEPPAGLRPPDAG